MELQLYRGKISMMTDEEIITLFFDRDEKAISETDRKYGKYLLTIAMNILQSEQDSAECQNDTYLSAWNSIPPARPQRLCAFLAKIMRGHAINRWNAYRREKRIPPERLDSLSDFEGFLPSGPGPEAELDTKLIGEVISGYLRSVSERKRYIFMSRYYYLRPIARIAEILGVSESTVKKNLSAIKAELRCKLESEGIAV